MRRTAPRALLVRASVEALPFRDGAFATVVASLVFCSVPQPPVGLAEVRRVLAPGGVVAVWTYNLARVDPEVDRWTDRLARQIVGPWWAPERRWVDEEYQTIPFPFDEIEIAPLRHEELWDLDRLTRYLRTWSSFQRYQKETGRDPLDEIREGLTAAWGDPTQERTVTWPIFIRAGRPKL